MWCPWENDMRTVRVSVSMFTRKVSYVCENCGYMWKGKVNIEGGNTSSEDISERDTDEIELDERDTEDD
jgi:hypothetical protein